MRARGMAVVAASLLASVLVGVQPAEAEGVRYVDRIFTDIGVVEGVHYGEAVDSKGVLQDLQLDIYHPVGDEATDRGLVIWAHGSGFRYGDRSDIGPLKEYVKRGWVGMSISYRMRPELPANAFVGIVTDPTSLPTAQAAAMDAMHDMQAAVRWARANAEGLGIDPERIVATGMSAGAIMALMVAFNEGDPGTSGTPGVSSAVAAAVSHAGAYVPFLQGVLPAPGAPPIAIYHGTHDEQVPFPTSPPACALTVLMGNTCEFQTYVGRDHTVLGADLAADFLYRYVIEPTAQPYVSVTHAQEDGSVIVRTGAERLLAGGGAVVGVDVPELEVVLEHTAGLVTYVLEALGVDTGAAALWR